MTPLAAIALLVVAVAIVVVAYLWQRDREAARIAANPLGRIGAGVGEIIGGIGGFIS